jgi:hypothetical protein
MNILEALLNAQNGDAARQLGSQFGLGEDQTAAALSAIVPGLAAGFARNASSGGLAGLTTALASGRHEAYLDDPGLLTSPATTADGNGILGHVLGSKDASRALAAQASQASGISPDLLKQMLPVVAAMMMGAMAKRSSGGALPGGFGPSQAGVPGGGLLDMLAPMLDRDRDGSVVDDVAGMLGKFLGGR